MGVATCSAVVVGAAGATAGVVCGATDGGSTLFVAEGSCEEPLLFAARIAARMDQGSLHCEENGGWLKNTFHKGTFPSRIVRDTLRAL